MYAFRSFLLDSHRYYWYSQKMKMFDPRESKWLLHFISCAYTFYVYFCIYSFAIFILRLLTLFGDCDVDTTPTLSDYLKFARMPDLQLYVYGESFKPVSYPEMETQERTIEINVQYQASHMLLFQCNLSNFYFVI